MAQRENGENRRKALLTERRATTSVGPRINSSDNKQLEYPHERLVCAADRRADICRLRDRGARDCALDRIVALMGLRRAYVSPYPELDRFLFAYVGKEAGGAPLSVLSALARLGLDAREEAARLSGLTKEAAADQLARMIGQLPERGWTLSEARTIAGELIDQLPAATLRPTVRAIWVRKLRAGLSLRLFDLWHDRPRGNR